MLARAAGYTARCVVMSLTVSQCNHQLGKVMLGDKCECLAMIAGPARNETVLMYVFSFVLCVVSHGTDEREFLWIRL